MKIKCDKCGAKYQVADDKVRHKVFKIRCKRCQHAIIVRTDDEPQEATAALNSISEEDGTRQEPRPDSAPPSDAIWHIVVDRQQVGPMTPEDIAGYLGRGEVDGDAFVWCDGLGDWQKMSTVQEFEHLFDSSQPVESAPSNPFRSQSQQDEKPRQKDEPQGAAPSQPGDEDEDEDDVVMSGPAPASDGLFGQVDAAAAVDSDGPRVDDPDQLKDQRNDNSVLFSLDALDAAANAPKVSNTGGSDGSGLIDLSMLNSGASGHGSEAVFGHDAGGGIEAVAAPQQMVPLVTRRRGNTALIITIVVAGLLVAAAVGVAVYFATKQDEPKVASKPPVEQATNKDTGRVAGRTSLGNAKPKASTGGKQVVNTQNEKAETNTESGINSVTTTNAKAESPGPTQKTAAASTDPKSTAVESSRSAKAKVSRAAALRKKTPSKWTKKQLAAKQLAAAKAKAKAKARRKAAEPVRTPKPKTTAPKEAPRAKVKEKPKKGGDEVDALLGALSGGGKKSARKAPARGPAPSAAPASADPLLPPKLGKRDILRVVSRHSGKVLSCRSADPELRGVVKVRIAIVGSTGRVSRASVLTPKFQGTPVGNCVAGKIRSLYKFPQFSNSSMSITIPFRL
ncbi:MAG: GYF domain-containing protein [Myxococcota bacterium]|nr:GYF domain-containing protein [Myxococcota bacterium]